MSRSPAPAIGGTNYALIHNAIRDAILAGELKQGERMKVQGLAERYGVSTNPIREALQQLQAEGLIEMIPNKGARVRVIDRHQAESLFEVREALDGIIARRAARVATDEDISSLRDLEDQLRKARASGSPKRLGRMATYFHERIGEIAGNDEAVKMRRATANLFALIRSIPAPKGQESESDGDLEEEHSAILDAIAARDEDAAEAAARAHARSSAQRKLARFGETV
ncbi:MULTISPECIES: GntR family transcriptional regulator [unclassified Roseivivax]|uniref:GntR family transcriptional regulator n=1 Tax=Roseivivax sp. GX 12232 TaxID=2900547 RepID=UPI001E529976|nr:GntR family transcriptional regulator [Roseivivax sp. GX 12232]MCE0504104.1 GntR family transcriptional regulator [Roseivivax sp. GX 12232]